MKKNICVILVIVTFVLLIGCSKGSTSQNTIPKKTVISQPKDNSSKTTVATPKIENYYPFVKNVKYMYAGNGNEYATYSVLVDYLIGNRQQIRVDNGGTEVVKVLENKDGELRLIFSKAECYYRENFTSKINAKPEILLKEPITKGTSWALLDGSIRSTQ